MALAYLYSICSSNVSDVEEVQPASVPSHPTNTIINFLRESHLSYAHHPHTVDRTNIDKKYAS